jgi:hypothetical protein
MPHTSTSFTGAVMMDRPNNVRLAQRMWARLCGVVATFLPLAACAAFADGVNPGVHAYPPSVHLSTAQDRQSIVVQMVEASGITRDLTSQAALTVADPSLVRIEGATLYPVADGDTTLQISAGGATLSLPVHVERASEDPHLSFRLDVMPIFMRNGCNSGACHGAARGKDGFRLSLFGFDPASDYHRLTREISGRRINLALPDDSLLLTKGTNAVPHGGGAKIQRDDAYYATIRRWLVEGAADDPAPAEVATVEKVEVYPPEIVLDGMGSTQQMTVRAIYSDGTDRDITSQALFLSNNDNSASIDVNGMVTAQNRGEAFLMARFDTHTVGIHSITLPAGLEFAWANPPVANSVDELIHNKLRKLRINPSELCSDEEFIRRVSIDICGVLPTSDEFRSFVASEDPNKRAHLIEQLLERKEFVDMWVMKWSELLMIRTVANRVDYKAMLLYYSWLQERIEQNTPIDKLAQELLAARGGTFSSPATNYFQHEQDTLKTAENIAQVFMGMRIQCAQCHNHPFDRWTMNDYYGFANFFSQIGRKGGEDPRETIVFNSGSGGVRHPVGGGDVTPKFLGGDTPDVAGKDRREVVAAWLASPANEHFGRNLVNIVWAHFFGKGIVEPVDDVRVSNPPVNKELLDSLTNGFVESQYDFKKLVRDICNSYAYQRSTATNDTNVTDERNFSRAVLRRVRSEVLLDMVTSVTDTKNKFRGLPLGARAVQIADGNTSTYFLTTFGRATRETACSCEVKMEPNLSQALHLLNGDTLHEKISSGAVVKKLLESGQTPDTVIDELYMRTLTRHPTEKEQSQLTAVVSESDNAQQTLEDAFWAILNSREFVFNH